MFGLDPRGEGAGEGAQIVGINIKQSLEWVNLSKRGGMDGVFHGLEGLARKSPASTRKTMSFPIHLLGFTFYFK